MSYPKSKVTTIDACCQRCGRRLPDDLESTAEYGRCQCAIETRVVPKIAAEDGSYIRRRLEEIEKEKAAVRARPEDVVDF